MLACSGKISRCLRAGPDSMLSKTCQASVLALFAALKDNACHAFVQSAKKPVTVSRVMSHAHGQDAATLSLVCCADVSATMTGGGDWGPGWRRLVLGMGVKVHFCSPRLTPEDLQAAHDRGRDFGHAILRH